MLRFHGVWRLTLNYLKSLAFIFLGLPLLVFGSWRLFEPMSFFAFNGLQLPTDPGSLSEARATGGVVVGVALLIITGTFVKPFRTTSLIIAATLFLSFAAARIVGLVADGFPGPQVVQGLVSEVLFGTAALVAFFKARARGDA